MNSISHRIALQRVALVAGDVFYGCRAIVARGGIRLILGLLGMASVHAAAESPPRLPQENAVTPVEAAVADAGVAVGKAEPITLAPKTDKAVNGQDASTPTAEQCNAPYPAGAQVKSARRIAYRDIRAAQAADEPVKTSDADGRTGQSANTTPKVQNPRQRNSAVEKG